MNKQGIRNQILGLLNRNDCPNELADSFIEQAMARIQRTLRVPSMERGSLITANAEVPDVIVIPDDFLNMKYLYTGSTLLEYVDIQRFLQYPVSVDTPKIYTRIQGQLKIKPSPEVGTSLTLIYYGEIPDLATDTSENFLTVAAPDLLIYGALAYAANYFLDERKPAFEQEYSRIYQELTEQALLTEMDQSGMAIATSAFTVEY